MPFAITTALEERSERVKRKEAERRLDILSNHDSLTKLPNRTYFQSLLKNCFDDAIANNQLAALMFIDIDNFKYMNDQFGYDAGDLILATISNRLCTFSKAISYALLPTGRAPS